MTVIERDKQTQWVGVERLDDGSYRVVTYWGPLPQTVAATVPSDAGTAWRNAQKLISQAIERMEILP